MLFAKLRTPVDRYTDSVKLVSSGHSGAASVAVKGKVDAGVHPSTAGALAGTGTSLLLSPPDEGPGRALLALFRRAGIGLLAPTAHDTFGTDVRAHSEAERTHEGHDDLDPDIDCYVAAQSLSKADSITAHAEEFRFVIL